MTLAARATHEALRQAGWEADDVDLLINTGVYRDRHLCEPAMAPFIQKRIGANPVPPARAGDRSTFSFDLSNGACGTLIALQTADGLLTSGRIDRAVVTAGDVDPTPRVSRGLRLAPMGAALALARGKEGEGFTAFHTRTFPEYAKLRSARVRWRGDEPGRPWRAGRQSLLLEDDPHYAEACAVCASEALVDLLGARELGLGDLDLVLPSPAPAGFATAWAERAGIPSECLLDAPDLSDAYTAALPGALERAIATDRWQRSRRTLLVAVGAGVSVSLALYERPPSAG